MKIVKFEEDKIIFDNGYELESYHDQDCCEWVYADFEVLKTYNVSVKTGKSIKITDIDFCENIIELVQGKEDCGFNMISKIGEKFFVPCYNNQDGYYSDKLELILYKKGYKEVMDISDFVKDII